MIINTIYYISSIFSIFFFIISVQFKSKKHILLSQCLAATCYFISYLILGAYSACAVEIIEQIKDFLFYKYEQRNKNIPFILLIIFIILLLLASIFTYNGPYSILPFIINLSYFISSYFKEKSIRIVMFICGFIWIYYNYKVGAYIIIIGNILEIISATISLIRYKDIKTEIKI